MADCLSLGPDEFLCHAIPLLSAEDLHRLSVEPGPRGIAPALPDFLPVSIARLGRGRAAEKRWQPRTIAFHVVGVAAGILAPCGTTAGFTVAKRSCDESAKFA